MKGASWAQWLKSPPVTGWNALLCGVGLVAVPTAARAAISGAVTGCEFTPYLPFVLFAAILIGWRWAVTVALASVGVLDGLFTGAAHEPFQACFLSGAGTFLASSAMIIGVAVVVRQAIGGLQNRGADENSGGVIFSLEKGQVWASWYGQSPPVCLGSQKRVGAMMEDYLAQVEIGERLTRAGKQAGPRRNYAQN